MEASSSSPVADSPAAQQNEVKCMYTAVCDTGSQPRKAISHIFGRNKLCTRMIPSHVWVHFCRKHYQRSRYRNAQEYAKVQCELVQRQVRRIQAWSDENKRSGQGGVVVDWSLSMRKREQNRVQEMSHRRHTSGQDSDEEDELDRAILNGTAVPDWLRAKVGDGYSTTEIEQMLERLADEVQKNNMTQIPDIEILPNITDIQDGSRNRVTLKRKASISSTHRRSQSVGDSLRPTLQPVSRRVARPNVGRSEDILQSPPPVKRQRISHDISSPNERPEYILRQPSERTLPPATTRQPTSLHQHSVSAGNRDHVDTYTGVNTRDRHHFGGPLLPSPTLQRSIHTYPSSHGQESFSESQDYFDARRPSHMRTHSESYHDFNYPSYHSSSEYQSYQNYDPSPSTYERNYMMPTINSSAPPTSHYGYYNQHPPSIPPMRSHENPSFWSSPVPGRSSSNSHRHGRHQSSPGVHQQMPRSSAPEYRSLSSPTLSTGGYEHPTYNRQQDPLASQHHPAYRPIVEESDKTKALYAERR